MQTDGATTSRGWAGLIQIAAHSLRVLVGYSASRKNRISKGIALVFEIAGSDCEYDDDPCDLERQSRQRGQQTEYKVNSWVV